MLSRHTVSGCAPTATLYAPARPLDTVERCNLHLSVSTTGRVFRCCCLWLQQRRNTGHTKKCVRVCIYVCAEGRGENYHFPYGGPLVRYGLHKNGFCENESK